MPTGNLARYGEYIALGAHIAGSMIIPVVIGIYIDRAWDLSPWGVIVGALMGFAGLISIVFKVAAKSGKTQYNKKNEDPGNGKV